MNVFGEFKGKDRNTPWALFNGEGFSVLQDIPEIYRPWTEAVLLRLEEALPRLKLAALDSGALSDAVESARQNYVPRRAGPTPFKYDPATLPTIKDPRNLPKVTEVPGAKLLDGGPPRKRARTNPSVATSVKETKHVKASTPSGSSQRLADPPALPTPMGPPSFSKPQTARRGRSRGLQRGSGALPKVTAPPSEPTSETPSPSPVLPMEVDELAAEDTGPSYESGFTSNTSGLPGGSSEYIPPLSLDAVAAETSARGLGGSLPYDLRPPSDTEAEHAAAREFRARGASPVTRELQPFGIYISALRAQHSSALAAEVSARALQRHCEESETRATGMPFGTFESTFIGPYHPSVHREAYEELDGLYFEGTRPILISRADTGEYTVGEGGASGGSGEVVDEEE